MNQGQKVHNTLYQRNGIIERVGEYNNALVAYENGRTEWDRLDVLSEGHIETKTESKPEPSTKRSESEILAPHEFEIEETYREQGQRAGDRLVASILRQEGFQPTSPKEQESTRQAIENERAGGNTAESEMNERAAIESQDKEEAIQQTLASKPC